MPSNDEINLRVGFIRCWEREREREREIEREHLRKMPHAQTHEQKLTEILLLRTFLVYLIVRERTLPVY